MKVLLVGAGGVGSAIASVAAKNDPKGEWLEGMLVSDYNLKRAENVAAGLRDDRFTAEKIDAGSKDEVKRLAHRITSYNVCYTKLLRSCGITAPIIR